MSVTFIVSTGRCGSTLLSRMLHAHPEILVLNEFFSPLWLFNRFFPEGTPSGAAFWKTLAEPAPALDAMVRHDLLAEEALYPYGSGRFRLQTGVPVICHMTLPLLTADPDRVFDELAAEVPRWPSRPAVEHYRHLFDWFAERFDRPVRIERSGTSLHQVHRLRTAFPEARFVHLFRDGPACAVSMSRHAPMRMAMLAEQAARIAGVSSPDQLGAEHLPSLPPELARLVAGDFDPEFVMNADLPPTIFGQLWSSLIENGLAELAEVPAGSQLAMRYETLIRDPAAELARLADFLGVAAAPAWLAEAAGRIDPGRRQSIDSIDAATANELRTVCAPGMRRLPRE